MSKDDKKFAGSLTGTSGAQMSLKPSYIAEHRKTQRQSEAQRWAAGMIGSVAHQQRLIKV